MNKQNQYNILLLNIINLLKNEEDFIANLSNISALINEYLSNINWVGFYIVKNNQLVLGPFQGKVACSKIEIGSGVCGVCVNDKKTQLVNNVHEFDGHISCDDASNSEIVIPVLKDKNVVALLDIDSPILNRFDKIDKDYLEKIVLEIQKKYY